MVTRSPTTTTAWTPSREHATTLEQHGWDGALLGTGWGRPDTFTVATALAARTTTFKPLIAIRPGYWRPANFASAASTLDHLSGGRVLVNIVSGQDDLGAYGDSEGDQAHRYARTKEFMQIARRLWTEEDVTYDGEHFQVSHSTVATRPVVRGDRTHPPLYFGGASEAAERVAATEADVQLFWGEPLDGVRERIERLTRLTQELGREHAPLEFGLRITTFVRDTTEQAWADAEEKVAEMAGRQDTLQRSNPGFKAVGQQRLLDLARVARCSTTTSTRRRAGSVAAGRAPPGSSGRRRTSRPRCGSTRTWGSPTSCSPTPRTCGRSGARATSCSRSCAPDRSPADVVPQARRLVTCRLGVISAPVCADSA